MQTISISKWVAAAVNPLVHGDLLNPNGIPSLSPATVLIVNGVHAAFNCSSRAPAVSEGSALMQ
jgi:hypothetical protein